MDKDLIKDPSELRAYSQDMSRYRIVPRAALMVRDESDVLGSIVHARGAGLPLTCRGAGSNLSGSAVGSGIILHFKGMDRIVSLKGGEAVVEPGIVYDHLNAAASGSGFFLPYHVSSSKYCTIGGNVGTKASGLRSIKYGTVDSSIRAMRFVSPAFGTVDTSAGLPPDLERALQTMKDDLLSDSNALRVLIEKTRLKTSSGYNLRAFVDHEDPRDIAAHLMVGSVGTLGIFTRIHLRLVPVPQRRVMIVAFFPGPVSACEAVPPLRDTGPSLLELMDGFGTGIVRVSRTVEVPEGAGSALLIEYDDDIERRVPEALSVLSRNALSHTVLSGRKEQDHVWGLRWSMLMEMKRLNETKDRRYVSFVDDLGVPVGALPRFITDIESIFAEERIPLIIYGHVGEGNLHLRPMIERDGWKEKVERVAERCFSTAFRYGGTIAAEHGSGRNRAAFIRREWGDRIYSYFRRIKELFDPEDMLNPGVMFSTKQVTDDLEF
jgi:FAD/FMN-containing dehydrogenase